MKAAGPWSWLRGLRRDAARWRSGVVSVTVRPSPEYGRQVVFSLGLEDLRLLQRYVGADYYGEKFPGYLGPNVILDLPEGLE